MAKRHKITAQQRAELEEARKTNKGKRVEKRLKALILRSDGKKYAEIGEICGYHPSYVGRLVALYCNEGLSAIVENHYKGNRRNMSFAEEEAFLDEYKQKSEQGHMIEVSALKAAYEEKVGHSIGGSQIYYVLHRHGWRRVMPRSKHPKKASDEVIETSKKLTHESKK